MGLTKRQQNKLEKEIEASYSRQASGLQIHIMKIGPLFKLATDLHLKGTPIDEAVSVAIEKFCEPEVQSEK